MSGRPMTITDPAMTRFMMSLEESVSLVKFAFENALSGDLFVRKAPACTIGDLSAAVATALGRQGAPMIEIGTRGSEKLFETLLSREERRRSQDMGNYFRIPLHASDLEYEVYVEEGNAVPETIDDYTSHNTERLGFGAMVEVLENLREFGALGSE